MPNEHSIPHNPAYDNVGEPMFHEPRFDHAPFDEAVLMGLERELKDSAERLGCGLSPSRTFAQLASEAGRRRRLRVTRQAGAGGIVAVVLLAGWFGAGQWSRPDPGQFPLVQIDQKVERSISQHPPMITANTDVPSHLAAGSTDVVVTPSNAHQEARQTEAPQKSVAAKQVSVPVSGAGPVPVLVHLTKRDGEVIVTPGVIVPEYTERLDWSQLGPEERREVWRVLNLEAEQSGPERPTI